MKKLLLHIYFTYVLLLIIVLLLVFFHSRGIVYYDEGYILNSALRITHGQIPYRDFDMVYTPLSFLSTAFFFHFFGESVFTGRLTALVVSLLSVFALYKIVISMTKNKVYTFLTIFFFLAWGPTHINFPWPTMFAICFTLYTLLFYQKALQEKNHKYFFWMGIMAMLIFFSKQNFGIGMIFVFFTPFIFLKNNKLYSLLYYVAGLTALSVIVLILLFATHSFFSFFTNLYVYTYIRIVVEKTLDTPFLYYGSFLQRMSKLCFYISPLLFSFVALFFAFKKQKNYIVFPLCVTLFYLLGIRPTTDYDHLSPLLAFSGITFPIIFSTTNNKNIWKLFFLICIGMIGFGFYTAYFNGYYKWNNPLKDDTIFAADTRIHVFLTSDVLQNSEMLKQYLDTHTKPNEPIFVNYYAPIIYFLADRPNASRYDCISSNVIPLSYQYATIQTLQKKHVKLILTLGENEQSLLGNYIRKNYHLTKKISGYDVYMSSSRAK